MAFPKDVVAAIATWKPGGRRIQDLVGSTLGLVVAAVLILGMGWLPGTASRWRGKCRRGWRR